MELKLSKRGEYVVRSAICLAGAYGSGASKKLRQVSAEVAIPRTFVSQILGDLVHAGLAVSTFGRDGGYRLARPPSEISLVEVVEAGEGPLLGGACGFRGGPCPAAAPCALHESWAAATNALRAELAATNLAMVAERHDAVEVGLPPAHVVGRAVSVSLTDAISVNLPTETVAARLRAGRSWLAPHLEEASAEHVATRLRVGPGRPSWLGKTVSVQLGEPDGPDDALVLPISWEATGPTGLFPRFGGTLHLRPLADRVELTLSGRYRPPFGRAGQVLDDAVLTHVATATMRSFLRRVARTLEDQVAWTPPSETVPLSDHGPASARRVGER